MLARDGLAKGLCEEYLCLRIRAARCSDRINKYWVSSAAESSWQDLAKASRILARRVCDGDGVGDEENEL